MESVFCTVVYEASFFVRNTESLVTVIIWAEIIQILNPNKFIPWAIHLKIKAKGVKRAYNRGGNLV